MRQKYLIKFNIYSKYWISLVTLTSRSFSKGSSKHENTVWITGADALMDSLKIHGVKVIFGYPGGAILPIYDAVHKAEQDGWLKH